MIRVSVCSGNCGKELRTHNGRLTKDLDEGDDGITEARDGRDATTTADFNKK